MGHRVDPFAEPGHWFKGNLHIHSTASDGRLTPDEVVGWYRERGYHFLALTDHGVLSEATTVTGDLITLSGIEVKGIDPQTGLYHLVGLGLGKPPDLHESNILPIQEAVNRLRAVGARVCVAHPYWSGQMSKDLLDLEGCFGLEIYNGACEVDDVKGLSTVHWDDLLAAGRRPWGLAVDDTHWRNGTRDAGLGWVWVKAAALTQEAILAALEQGAFYASSGPQIQDLRLDEAEGQVYVRCSPSRVVDFIGNAGLNRRFVAPPGGTLTEVSYRLRVQQRYVRVACQDTQHRWAWSNPIFLDPEGVMADPGSQKAGAWGTPGSSQRRME